MSQKAEKTEGVMFQEETSPLRRSKAREFMKTMADKKLGLLEQSEIQGSPLRRSGGSTT